MKRKMASFGSNSVKDIYSFVHNCTMRMRKREVRSRARKPTSRKKVAARKHMVRVVKRARITPRKALRMARPVRKKGKIRRRVILGRLADEHVRNLLLEVAGEKALAVAEALEEPLSDEDLAGACKLKVSEVRAVLNKLHSFGLTSYERTRDKESGWYSYIWRLSLVSADKILNKKKEVPEGAGLEKSFEFYTCSSCKKGEGVLIPFEAAFGNKFKCMECGAPLAFVEKSKEISK
jgi:transcription initiation factor TFIIE subunit alpha